MIKKQTRREFLKNSAVLGAGLAAAALAEELGGRVVILGTPGEGGGGGDLAGVEGDRQATANNQRRLHGSGRRGARAKPGSARRDLPNWP